MTIAYQLWQYSNCSALLNLIPQGDEDGLFSFYSFLTIKKEGYIFNIYIYWFLVCAAKYLEIKIDIKNYFLELPQERKAQAQTRCLSMETAGPGGGAPGRGRAGLVRCLLQMPGQPVHFPVFELLTQQEHHVAWLSAFPSSCHAVSELWGKPV